MLKATLLITTITIIIITSIALLFIYIKNCLVNTTYEQINDVKEYILEKANDLQIEDKVNSIVEKLENSEVMEKFTSIKDYLNKLRN